MFQCSHTLSKMFSYCNFLKFCSLFPKIGSCSLVPFDILPMFPCFPKPLGDPPSSPKHSESRLLTTHDQPSFSPFISLLSFPFVSIQTFFLDFPSPLKTYFYRPQDRKFNHLQESQKPHKQRTKSKREHCNK